MVFIFAENPIVEEVRGKFPYIENEEELLGEAKIDETNKIGK